MIKPAEAKPAAVGAAAGNASIAGARVAATPQPAARKAPPLPTPSPAV